MEAKDIALIGGLIVSSIGLFFNAFATLKSISSRKLSNYQEIVKSHREIWKLAIDKEETYSRIGKDDVDLEKSPITSQEKRFVQFVIIHMTSSYNFSKHSEIVQTEKLKFDFKSFMALPIPSKVWTDTKHFYNRDFVDFIDLEPSDSRIKRILKRIKKYPN